MTPLQAFLSITQRLSRRPFVFLEESEQKMTLEDAKDAVLKSKATLEGKELEKTRAYALIQNLETAVSGDVFDEVAFIQNLANLIEVYKLAGAKGEMKKTIMQLEEGTDKAKDRVLEYHLHLEILEKQAGDLSDEDMAKKDMETIETIGIFFVLELTVYLLSLFPSLSDEDKKKALYNGLKTESGDMPSYAESADGFRRDLCLKIFDETLRQRLLEAFYTFEETFHGDDLPKTFQAFKDWNLELLNAFKEKGVTLFTTKFLSPFGKEISMDELIKTVEAIEV